MTYLLDVNVLIALIDPGHAQHNAAHDWFAVKGRRAWATCPVTENGLLRILGHASYPNSPGKPAAVVPFLQTMCALDGHAFWPDDLSLLDKTKVDATRLLNSGQITDSYLLALAHAHSGKLATFDRRLAVKVAIGASKSLELIT